MVGIAADVVVALGEEEKVEDFEEALKERRLVDLECHSTLLYVTFVGFVAIWHEIAPNKHLVSRWRK